MDGIFALIVIMFLLFLLGLLGGVFFSILNIWTGILHSKWRFLAYIVSLVLVFFLCIGDELIERHQVEQLCHQNNSDQQVLNVAKKLQGKTLIADMESQPDIPTRPVPIRYYKTTYKDAHNGRVYFIEYDYYQNNGWYITFLKNSTGIESSAPLLKFNDCLHSSLSDYAKIYQFNIVKKNF